LAKSVIDYTITDGNGGFDDSRVFVTVNNINDAVANDDWRSQSVVRVCYISCFWHDTECGQ